MLSGQPEVGNSEWITEEEVLAQTSIIWISTGYTGSPNNWLLPAKTEFLIQR